MIVVDSSAIMAILLNEPEYKDFYNLIINSRGALVSVASVLETKMVWSRRCGSRSLILIDEFFKSPKIEIVPVMPEDSHVAYSAFITYGKGSGHPANLNFGDLFSYALAKSRNLPLLFKGEDFSKTDIHAAYP